MTENTASSDEITVDSSDFTLIERRSTGTVGSINERLTRTMMAVLPTDALSLRELGFVTALEAMADNSKTAMAADLTCYAAWCREARRDALPADPENLVRYLQMLEKRGYKPATLARRIASIATANRLAGLDDGHAQPTNTPMVRAALKAVRRRKGAHQRQAAPLRLGSALDPTVSKGFTLAALLDACAGDLQGLRDAALLSLGYDAGLRVSELVLVEERHIEPQEDGSATLFLPSSKADQEKNGAWAWLSADTMRRVGAWLEASAIRDGPLFRRVGVDRRRIQAGEERNRHADEPQDAADGEQALPTYSIGTAPLTRQGVNLIYRRVALAAFDKGLVKMPVGKVVAAVKALSTHSLRVGLTQDLFAAGEDGVGIAQALRWSSPTTALRYGRKLAVRSNVAARVLSRLRC
jgi:site-specific recombinase XerC